MHPAGILRPTTSWSSLREAVPFVPPMEGLYDESGVFRKGVFVFRTFDDCAQMIDHTTHARRAVVIGGGLLGLEAARGLLNRGLNVHVVHLANYLMDSQLDSLAGELLKGSLEEMGVTFHLEKVTTAVLGEDRVTSIRFKDNTEVPCDMVVISAGIRPNVDLAKISGLNIRRGILINDDLACRNDPNIYAIGECAEHRDVTYGLVAPLWEQARVLADRLTGRSPNARYVGSKVATKLKVMGVDLAVAGVKEARDEHDEVVTYVEPGQRIYKKLIVRDGQIAGAILLNDSMSSPRLLQAFDRDERLPDSRAELLFGLAGALPSVDVATLPGRYTDLQLQRCEQGPDRYSRKGREQKSEGRLRLDQSRHRLWFVQATGSGSP